MLSEEASFHPRLPHLPRRQDQAVEDWKTTKNRGGWANILQAGILTPLISLMELTNGLNGFGIKRDGQPRSQSSLLPVPKELRRNE